ncbi:hypothetical protein BDZ97DRAFT_1924462 [Flammula alnicola]|nr:hypothetical protein BDZ97DRAFT_1924462 [Flammula alnicola]
MTPEPSRSGYIAGIDRDIKDPVKSMEANNLRAEFEETLKKTARLEARLYEVECENTNLKFKLKRTESELTETQALLGKAVVAASRKEKEPGSPPASGPSRIPDNSLKRKARSPSLEIVEVPAPSSKKLKEKEKVQEAPTRVDHGFITPRQTHKVADVSISVRSTDLPNTPVKSENLSRTKVDPGADDDLVPLSKPNAARKGIPVGGDGHPNAASKGRTNTGVVSSSSSSCTPVVSVPAQTSPNLKEVKPRYNIKSQHVFSLPQSVADIYLKGAKALEISPPPLDLEVPRTFLRLAYGGNDQQFLQFIQEGMNPSGPVLRRLVFPMLHLNPSMPSSPGEPGLVFASRHEILSNPPWTVFCKRSNAKALWIYLGEYESVLGGKMTAEQFRSQSNIVQREWAKILLKQKKFDVYVSMRARIALRLASIIPIDDKAEEKNLILEEVLAVKNGKGRPVTEDDIICAFSKGNEGIDIIRMTCVKYDHVFADDMKAKFSNYDTLLAATAKKKNPVKSKGSIAQRKVAKTGDTKPKNRAPAVSNDSDSDDSTPPSEARESHTPIRQRRPRRASRKMIESMTEDVGEDNASDSEDDAFSDYVE